MRSPWSSLGMLLISLSAQAVAPSGMQKPDDPRRAAAQTSHAQHTFDRMKSLAGTWKGEATMRHGAEMHKAPVRVSVRVTSGGAALMHEMVPEGRRDDPTRGDDDPITMFYLDGDRLLLTHYCDSAMNRPRMAGGLSADGKSVRFDFLDVSGGTKDGYMNGAAFTIIDADHHSEDWTYMMPGGKPGDHAHIDLVRTRP